MSIGDARDALPEGRNLAARVKHLFQTIVHPRPGEPYTNAEVSRMSAGSLAEEEVEGIRSGAIPDLTVRQVAPLAAAFGVESSYLVDRKEPPLLDAELLKGLSDETTRQITRQALRLPEREGDRARHRAAVRRRVVTKWLACSVVAVWIAAAYPALRPRGRLRERWALRERRAVLVG